MRWLLVLLSVLLASGCVIRDDVTRIELRDPAQVVVEADGAAVLSDGSNRGAIPAAAYLGSAATGSWIEREAPPELDAWCPACRYWRHRTILDGPLVKLEGTPAGLLRFDGADLHIRWIFNDAYRCGRRGALCPDPQIALDVVTARSNVRAITYDRLVSPHNGKRDRMWILPVVVLSVLATGIAADGLARHAPIAFAPAGFCVGLIGLTLALELPRYYARDAHQTIPP